MTPEKIENQRPETEHNITSGQIWVNGFLEAFHDQNLKTLSGFLSGLQKIVHGDSRLMLSEVSEREIQELLETGEVIIYVGAGTAGQRIYVDVGKGELYMPFDEKYSGKYAQNFRDFFGLPENDQELRLSFN